jgi:hypothetical protein
MTKGVYAGQIPFRQVGLSRQLDLGIHARVPDLTAEILGLTPAWAILLFFQTLTLAGGSRGHERDPRRRNRDSPGRDDYLLKQRRPAL